MKSFKTILCVVAPGATRQPALERAVMLAENNQARLTVATVVPRVPEDALRPDKGPTLAEWRAALVDEQIRQLDSMLAPYRQRIEIKASVLMGTAFLEIIRAVLRDGYDLLIKPAENPDFLARMFGSDDMHLLRKCPCPVWLTKPEEKSDYDSILAAVDFDLLMTDIGVEDLNQRILELSASLALSDFAALHLVHVWDTFAEGKIQIWSTNPDAAVPAYVEGERLSHEGRLLRLGDWLKDLVGAETYDYLSPRFHLLRGQACKLIPALARDLGVDLVVMGTVARTGISGLIIGNTAETILEQLACSVLTVKPAGFVSPVKIRE